MRVAEANKMPSILCFPERRNLSEGDSVKFNIVLRGIMGGYPQNRAIQGRSRIQTE